MNLHDALSHIDAIRAQVARSEVFRGYRAATVACTGWLALAAAAAQAVWIPDLRADLAAYLRLWIVLAMVNASLVGLELLVRWFRTDSALARQQTLAAVEQFLPCLLVGAGLTAGIVRFAPQSAELLPGFWAMLFALGIFASARQLPAAIRLVAVYYVFSGMVCIAGARGEQTLSPWAMVGTFGLGQLLAAAVLHWGLERDHDE